MGWVGVATLIATTCYLLYRFPPPTWGAEPAPLSPAKPPAPSSPSESRPLAEDEDEGDDTEESQSTPKASACTAPVLEIPTLHLGNDLTPEPKSPMQNGSARSPAPLSAASNPSPPPPPPTTTANKIPPTPSTTPMAPPPPPSQRPASGSGSNTTSLMPPPSGPRPRPLPSPSSSSSSSSSLLSPPQRYPPRPNTSGSSTLAPPPSSAATARGASRNSLAPTKLIAKPSRDNSKRAVLDPGFSPLDWAALTANPNNKLRGANLPPHLLRVTPSMLKAQNGRKGLDAWTSYQGKVYNISPYLPFHPGGKGELLRGAGKDSAKLFFEIHPWVNWDAILGECLVGILVSETENEGSNNTLDAMD
ncbi:hypothetical protein FE257_001877 [Aspergillus nanangensis]|uniref:Cytochrome b5 heme-binding domain-containing protein n=1 Tax=Aspergillus nanangensis TaxID=2582783 RepID=A0AAD4CD67_ASPNN|nr:hypothetical protein FE257_001877 [Aspergillus nanangensis]